MKTLCADEHRYSQLDQRTNDAISETTVDNAGNPGSRTDDYVYTFDPNQADALTQVTDNGTTIGSFSYDGVGNFKNNAALGAANSVNEYSNLTYNPRHDLTDDGQFAYGYDALDRLISVTPDAPAVGSLAAQYGYDGQGRMAWEDVYTYVAGQSKPVLSSTYHFLWNGDELVAKLDANYNLLQQYTWGPGEDGTDQVIALTDFTQSGGPHTYELTYDASGNVAMMLDPVTGAVVADYLYAPFGATLSATGPEAGICPFGFKGYWTDAAVDPSLAWSKPDTADGTTRVTHVVYGFWLQDDPTGIDGGLNPKQPFGGDPINNVDPNGTRFESLKALWAVASNIITGDGAVRTGVATAKTLGADAKALAANAANAATHPYDFQTGETLGVANAAVSTVTGTAKLAGAAKAYGDTLLPQALDALAGAPDRNESAYAPWAQFDTDALALQLPDALRQHALNEAVDALSQGGWNRQALTFGVATGGFEFNASLIAASLVDPLLAAGEVGAVAEVPALARLATLDETASLINAGSPALLSTETSLPPAVGLSTGTPSPLIDLSETEAESLVSWVDEGGDLRAGGNPGMRPDAYAYQSGAAGARSSVLTGRSQVPYLEFTDDAGTVIGAKFDGVYGSELIDRKLNPFFSAKAVDEATDVVPAVVEGSVAACAMISTRPSCFPQCRPGVVAVRPGAP